MSESTLVCQSEKRRNLLRAAKTFYGLDYVEVTYDNTLNPPKLAVYLFGQWPNAIDAASFRIEGGERIPDIQILRPNTKVTVNNGMLELAVDQAGDFSTYRLCLEVPALSADSVENQPPYLDPRYACVDFLFRGCCPTDLDCHSPMVCPPPRRVDPEINYLAKDYASFCQIIYDRLALLLPAWQERHAPDVGVTLVELLAYVGDYLSYYQDAVATEAYLGTARQRISVRRHARLVDYHLHEGCNARAWLTLWTNEDSPAIALQDIYFSTESENGSVEFFEPVSINLEGTIQVFTAHNEITFHTWGNKLCCLTKGSTQATLLDAWVVPPDSVTTASHPSAEIAAVAVAKTNEQGRTLQLQEGDVLIFEEVIGPNTGDTADADPSRRWPVRLTRVTPGVDPLIQSNGRPTPVVQIEWSAEDALPFPFCLSARLPAPDCGIICNVSVARGNVILVDGGWTIDAPEPLGQVGLEEETGACECEGSAVEMTSVPCVFRPPPLQQSPLTFREKIRIGLPASQMLVQDPRKAMPQISLTGLPGICPDTADAGPPKVQNGIDPLNANWSWAPLVDLIESGPMDQNFVVEVDNVGLAHLRFGDGALGRMPDACMIFQATYRVGNGATENVSAESITKIYCQNVLAGIELKPRNPLPAEGGVDPEPTEEAKLFAPGAFRKLLERAITAADYAQIAERNPNIQEAQAALRWTGSWYEAQVAIDPLNSESADDTLLQKINGFLYRYRRLGYDLLVTPPRYVPLDIEMTVCVLPQYLRGHVEAALLEVFSNRVLPDGSLGFFHPDNLTFGEGIYLSKIIAAAQSTPGAQSVMVTTFQRLFEPPNGELLSGVLSLGPMEIAQLDNDPSFPEHGVLKLTMGGGR